MLTVIFLFTNKATPFWRFWQHIINKSDYLHWIKYTRQIYQLYTIKHTPRWTEIMPISHTNKAEVWWQKLHTGKKHVTQVRWFSKRKSARTLVDGKLFYKGNLYQKKGRLEKMNTFNKQPASLPVFVDVLFWEPQIHAKTVSSSSPFW